MKRRPWFVLLARAFFRAPSGRMATAGVLLVIALAIAAPFIWGSRATQMNFGQINLPASLQHPFGTDQLGRSVFDRTMVATRLSLELGVTAAGLGLVVGYPIGALVSVLTPRLRGLGRGIINATLSFPSLLLALVVVAILGPSERSAVIAVGLGGAPYFARLSESLGTSTVARDYVACARVIGVGRRRLVTRYIMPNVAEPILITGITYVAGAIIDVAALSFLGVGVQPPAYDWGALLNAALPNFFNVPLAVLGPAAMIAFTGLVVTLLAEAVARAFNPALWSSAPERPIRSRLLLAGNGMMHAGRTAAVRAPHNSEDPTPVVSVSNLKVSLPGRDGPLFPVEGISFEIAPGEVVGVVGESGSGKTMTALALAQLVPFPGTVSADSIRLDGQDMLTKRPRERNEYLGRRVAMIFQNPMASLNPCMRIGPQLTDGARLHQGLDRRNARARAIQVLAEVNIAKPRAAMNMHPFEFSGGMRQRAMIAMGLMASRG